LCTSFYTRNGKKTKEIKTVPEVQIVMDMDGLGSKVLKRFL
jgi:hypothetical protein